MGVYTHSQGNWLSRRGTFLVILIGFHLVLFWALKSGFAVKFIESITPPIVADIIQEVKPEEPPPPPPEVQMVELPPVSVPPVLVDIQVPPPPPPIAAVTTAPPVPNTPPPPIAVQAPPRPAVVVAFKVTNMPDPRDYYPSASISAQEEGIVKVKMCFGTNGRVTSAEVSESSGKPRLDAAGVKLANAVRANVTKIDGVAQAECKVLPIRFSLKDAM